MTSSATEVSAEMAKSKGKTRVETSPGPGFLKRLFGRFHVHGVFWYRIHLFAVRRVPSWTFYLLVPLFTFFFYVALRKIRRAIASNLEVVLGPCGFLERERRLWRNLYNYSWCLTERYEDLATNRRVVPVSEGDEIWQRAMEGGQGLLVVTAHIGHWEVASAYPADLHGRQIHVVREAEINPEAQELFQGLLEERSRAGYRVHFARRAGDLGPKLLLALRDGDLVALQGDRPAREGRVLETRLFGRPFRVPIGPAAMARAAEAPIVPVFVYRTGRLRSKLAFRPAIEPQKTADRDADLQRTVDLISSEVEAAIRADPYQWYCFTELWPAGSEG